MQGLLIETQARRPTEIVFAVFVPVRWAKRAFIRTQKNGCGGNLTITAAVFLYIGGGKMQPENSKTLTKAETELIKTIRSLEFGEVRVIVKDNRPIRIEEIRKSIQLTPEK